MWNWRQNDKDNTGASMYELLRHSYDKRLEFKETALTNALPDINRLEPYADTETHSLVDQRTPNTTLTQRCCLIAECNAKAKELTHVVLAVKKELRENTLFKTLKNNAVVA